MPTDETDPWLDLLLTHRIEPRLGAGRLTFLHDYPASQAALARLRSGDPPVGERFELYLDGIRLANGFHELGDAGEQRRRFEAENAARRYRDCRKCRSTNIYWRRWPPVCRIAPAWRSASTGWRCWRRANSRGGGADVSVRAGLKQ